MNDNLFYERISLFKDAAQHRQPKRIPMMSEIFSWAILDAGYTLSEATQDLDKMEQIHYMLHEKYGFDCYSDTSIRNPFILTNILGAKNYTIDDEKGALNVEDLVLMYEDEYPELIENQLKFIWEKALPRKYSGFSADNNLELLHKSVLTYLDIQGYIARLNKTYKEKYQVPLLVRSGDAMNCAPDARLPDASPLSLLFCFLRGMKGLAIDLRRRPEKIDELYQINYETSYKPAIESLKAAEYGTDSEAPFDYISAFLVENILTLKQFEKYQWPCLQETLRIAGEKGKITYIAIEGNMDRFADYFQDIPKGTLVLQLENDNIFEMRKKLPNIALSGGMPCFKLYHGTKQECVDYAKKLIDELSCDGGYIYCQDKMVSYRNDAKSENMLAVNEFIRNYRV